MLVSPKVKIEDRDGRRILTIDRSRNSMKPGVINPNRSQENVRRLKQMERDNRKRARG